jgi:hypothetical protein
MELSERVYIANSSSLLLFKGHSPEIIVHHIAPRIDIIPKSADTIVEPRLENFMRKQKADPIDMPQGTLDMLILRTFLFGPRRGHAIASLLNPNREEA